MIITSWGEEGCDGELVDLDWKKLFEIDQNKVLGLDIGSSAVKIVQLEKNGSDYVVVAAGIIDIPLPKKDKGHEEYIVRAVRQCIEAAQPQTQWAVCSVCGPETAVRHFEFPTLPSQEVQGAILLEAEQVCPFGADDSTVDYQLMPNGENTISGILVAATNDLIAKKRRLTENAVLSGVLMDIDGLALLNCFSKLEKPQPGQTIAVLNVGYSYANLVIMNDNALPFVRDIVYAGRDIIEQIADEKNLSPKEVIEILSSQADPNQTQLEINSRLGKASKKLIIDVTETLRYYAAKEKTAVIEKLFVCGGFALVKGFVELLDSHLNETVVLWNPLDDLRCEAGPGCESLIREKGPAMAVAAGLAMRSI